MRAPALLTALLLSAAQALTPGAAHDPAQPFTYWNLDQLTGRVQRVTTTGPQGVTYTRYSPDGQTRTITTPDGRESSNRISRYSGNTYSINYSAPYYDTTGCLKQVAAVQWTGNDRSAIRFTCDPLGREIGATWQQPGENGRTLNMNRATTYTSDRRIATGVTTRTDATTGERAVTLRVTTTYAASGLPLTVETDAATRTMTRYEYTFDARGNWITRTRLDARSGAYVTTERLERTVTYY